MYKLNNVKVFLILILYYLLLSWIYKNHIILKWSYSGFENNETMLSLLYSLIGVLFTFFSFIKINYSNNPSSIIMNLMNLLFYVPIYIYIGYKNPNFEFFAFVLIYQFVSFLTYISWNVKFKPIIFKHKDVFYFIVSSILLINFFILIYYNGFKIKIDLDDVYENRLAVRELKIPTVLLYIKFSSYYVAIIALMLALQKGNFFFVTIIVLLQLMGFAFGANKTQFFSLFICFIAFYFYSNKIKLWFPISLILLLIFSFFEGYFINTTAISDVVLRRTFFMPSQISFFMYDFFETPGREFLYLRESILKGFGLGNPYEKYIDFQRYIGLLYFGRDEVNANTGLLGNDYAQFGWLSLFIYPFLRVYLLKMLDYCSQGIERRVLIVLCIFITFSYISGAFFTVLFTKGILLVNYLLYCYPNKDSR